MNISRLFILRPVATTLLMVAILLAGAVAYKQLPVSALPQVDYPDHPGAHLLSRRQPGCDGDLDHRAAGAPVRPDAGPDPDDLDQLRRQLGHHPAVQPGPEPGRGRAAGAGGHQRRFHLPAQGPAQSAGLQQGQSGRRADPDPGADLRHPAAAPGRGPGRHPLRPEDLPAAGGRPGEHQRRPAPGGAGPGQPDGPGLLRPDPGGPAQRHRRRQRQPGQGGLRRPATGLYHRRQRPALLQQGLPAAGRRLQKRRAGAPVRCGRRGRRYRERQPGGLDER